MKVGMAYARISVLSLFAMGLGKFFSDNGLFLTSGLVFNLLCIWTLFDC